MFVFAIKKVRLEKGISVSKLSKNSNLSRTYIRELENNKRANVSLSALYKIADVLNVNVKDLFYTKYDINTLKKEMHKMIDMYGLNSKKVLETSQVLDLLINIEMQEKNK